MIVKSVNIVDQYTVIGSEEHRLLVSCGQTVFIYSTNQPQDKHVLRVPRVCLRVCVYTYFVCYVDILMAACYTTQSHTSASVTQVFNNAHKSITCCSLRRY